MEDNWDSIIGCITYLDKNCPVIYAVEKKSPKEIEKEYQKFIKAGYIPTSSGWRKKPY